MFILSERYFLCSRKNWLFSLTQLYYE